MTELVRGASRSDFEEAYRLRAACVVLDTIQDARGGILYANAFEIAEKRLSREGAIVDYLNDNLDRLVALTGRITAAVADTKAGAGFVFGVWAFFAQVRATNDNIHGVCRLFESLAALNLQIPTDFSNTPTITSVNSRRDRRADDLLFTVSLSDGRRLVIAWDDESHCCEYFGCELSQGLSDLVGKKLVAVKVTHTDEHNFNWTTEELSTRGTGCIAFVTLELTQGPPFQFAFYNDHNGYYGHSLEVSVGGRTIAEETL